MRSIEAPASSKATIVTHDSTIPLLNEFLSLVVLITFDPPSFLASLPCVRSVKSRRACDGYLHEMISRNDFFFAALTISFLLTVSLSVVGKFWIFSSFPYLLLLFLSNSLLLYTR